MLRRAFALLVVASALGAQGTVPGYYMETRNITSGVSPAASREVIAQTWTSGHRSRRAGIAPVSSMFPEGTFILVDSATPSYIVSPSSRTIRKGSISNDDSTMVVLGSSESPQFTRVGPGEDILGHHTTIYELSQVVSVAMPITGDSGLRTMRFYRKIWFAADSTDPVVRATMRPRKPSGAGLPPGVALKTVGTTTTTGSMVLSTSAEVVALRLMDIDTSMFTLPPDYTVIDMGDELKTMRANLDSMRRFADKISPSINATQRRMMDSLLGPADTTKRRKP